MSIVHTPLAAKWHRLLSWVWLGRPELLSTCGNKLEIQQANREVVVLQVSVISPPFSICSRQLQTINILQDLAHVKSITLFLRELNTCKAQLWSSKNW